MAIEKLIHRLWLGPHPIPDEYVDYGRKWEAFGYEVRHWTETNLPTLVNRDEYEQIAKRGVNTGIAPRDLGVWTQRADLVSYELVNQFGGIYANMDIEPLRPLDDLLEDVDAFAAWESKGVICNAIFGATAHHPFIEACVGLLPGRFHDLANHITMQQQTGPGCITAAYSATPALVTVFDRELFYPYSFENLTAEIEAADYPDAYTAHHWGHTKVRS